MAFASLASLLAQGGHLALVARMATVQGLTEARDPVSLSMEGEFDDPTSIVETNSSVVVTPQTLGAATQVTRDYLYTWHLLKIVDVIRRRNPASPDHCRWTIPDDLEPAESETLMPLLGGVANIDGVRITQITPDSRITFRPGRNYLVIGNLCDKTLSPAYPGDVAVFEILPSGEFAQRSTSPRPLSETVFSLRTLARFSAFVRSLAVKAVERQLDSDAGAGAPARHG
jgi:hypothetical protein